MNCVDSPQFVRTSQGNVITSLIHWCKSLSIKPQHKALVRSLIDYHGQDGRCYPSISRLADELNCSRHTIHRWLNILEQEGILSRVHRYRENGGKTSNSYRLFYKRHRDVASVRHKKRVSKCNTHAVSEQNVIYKELEGMEHLEGVLVPPSLEPPLLAENEPRARVPHRPEPQAIEPETSLPDTDCPKSSVLSKSVLEKEGLLTGFDLGDEEAEHQISNLALPTTQPSQPEKPTFTEPAHKSTLTPKVRAAKGSVIPSNYAKPRSKDNLVVRVSETSITSRVNEPREQTSFSTPRQLDENLNLEANPSSSSPRRSLSENSTKRKYSIDISKMKSLAECIKHHRIAIEQKWIDSGARTRLSYFSSWAKVMRLWRDERINNPAAMMVHVIKSGLLHKYPANCDEEKALKILRELKAQEAREYWGE
jgi:DNA-binding transcriptional regulator YhcF (GntR family)